jgi:hypothetical protein
MALTTGKIAEVLFESALEEYEHQMSLMSRVEVFKPEAGTLQNADNAIWRPVQQHAPVIDGFDLTGLETGIIEETYPAVLGTPTNDFVEQRIDQMRDETFWRRRGKQSGKRQATELNKRIAQLVANTGSLFFRSNTASGYDFVAEAQAMMNERQVTSDERCFLLNDRSSKKFGSDLAGRQTLQGRPETVWSKGQIAQNIAEFDVYTGSFLPTIAGGAASTTTTAALSFKPEAGTVDLVSNTVTNVDYRQATIPVTSSASFAVGDKVSLGVLKAIGLADKTLTDEDMTFSIVAIPDGTSITVFPKPIALDDAALSTLEKAYANVDTIITNGATVTRLNTDSTARTNIFWAKDSIEVVGGEVPMDLMAQFDGKKVISETMSNGQTMYMVYDGDIATLNLRFRIFTWYGLTNKNPMANGVAVSF